MILAGPVTLGRRTSLLACPGTWGGGRGEMRMWGGRSRWKVWGVQSLHISCLRSCLGPRRMRTLEKSLGQWNFGRISQRQDVKGWIKRPGWRVHSFIHSLITIYWLPLMCQGPVLNAEDSALYKILNAVVLMEPSFWSEETADTQAHKKINTITFSLEVLWRI